MKLKEYFENTKGFGVLEEFGHYGGSGSQGQGIGSAEVKTRSHQFVSDFNIVIWCCRLIIDSAVSLCHNLKALNNDVFGL